MMRRYNPGSFTHRIDCGSPGVYTLQRPLLKPATILSKIELSTQPKEKRLALRRLKKSRTEPTRIVADLSPNISGRVIPCRWQQQHRASTCIRHWLNLWVIHRARSRLARLFHLRELRHA